MESTSSSCGSHHHLPPGFRFHPTDEELVVHYLKKKVASTPLPVSIIAEIDLYKYDPWELPSKASFGEQEWYFFTPRDRKYPNGARPNRAATSGYWKATGTDKPIHTANGTQKVGVKKALVFYGGKPPKGIKTNWIMHEYRLFDNKPPGSTTFNNKGSLRLDDWVLCRIFKKTTSSSRLMDLGERDSSMDRKMVSTPSGSSINGYQNPVEVAVKPTGHEPGLSFENNYHENFFSEMLSVNGSTIEHHANPMSISQITPSSSKPDYQKHNMMSSGYWNNATFNEHTASFISMINENSENTADFRHNNTDL